MSLKDGIFSALLIASGGTFASPTGISEVDLLSGGLSIPWERGRTQSQARKTRSGPRAIDGQDNLGTSFDFTVEDDPEDANLIALMAALNNKTQVILMACPYLSAPNTPPTDAPYIKGKYRIYGGTPDHTPGSPNSRRFTAAVHISCPANEAPVLVEPE